MKRIALAIFIFLGCFCSAQSPFTKIRTAIHEGNPESAFSILDSCFNKNYYKDSALFYKGLAHLKLGRIKEAKKDYTLLLKTYPTYADAHYLNGLIQFSDNNFGKSIDEFNLVLKTNPKHIKALYNRSVAFGILEDYLSAIEDLSACIVLNPDYALAYYSRGYWYEYTGNYIESVKDYENTIRLDPKNYDAYIGLAYMYQTQKETSKACEVINKAINAGSQIAEELKNNFCR